MTTNFTTLKTRFRVWNPQKRKMYYSDNTGDSLLVVDLEGQLIEISPDGPIMPDDFVSMQYIGIKDKESTDVFDCDIVIMESLDILQGTVFFNPRKAQFMIRTYQNGRFVDYSIAADENGKVNDLKVIGNIFEK